jgi:hypothetical protein
MQQVLSPDGALKSKNKKEGYGSSTNQENGVIKNGT